jgi:glutamate-ammonia-ligase adenylyltransferase
MPDPIRKIALSRFAQQRLAARPELAAEVMLTAAAAQSFGKAEIAGALAGFQAEDEVAFKRRLRRLRERVLLRTMARDLEGAADLSEVCLAMSALADASIRAALEWLGEPDLIVVAMGKLGGFELNVSSDIDLVFVHPDSPERPADPQRLDRSARKLIALLSEVTEDGFAFRVDMRLRPYGDSGALVSSFDALESYFVAQGREWERYAWIKARFVSGSDSDRQLLQDIVRPFVFRKYLDYGTIEAMRRLHAEVRRDVERRELAEHVKLGPGGIREIEFIAQALQLVRGGRDPELTARPTLAVLDLLGRKRLLPAEAVAELSEAYVFLRNVEHRL